MKCEPAAQWIGFIYSRIGTISIVLALVSIGAHVAYYLIKKTEPNLDTALAKMGAGAVLAPAIAMVFSTFDLDNLLPCKSEGRSQLSLLRPVRQDQPRKNLELYILTGSITILWISIAKLFPRGGLERPGRRR
jgi:hypothetical protein